MPSKYISRQELPASQQLKLVKREAKHLCKTNHKDRNHKFYLNLVSRKYGYENYDALLLKFKEELRNWQNKGRELCESRTADPHRSYYFVTMHDSFQYSYYSHWVAWDNEGYELRIPSQMNPAWVIEFVRESMREPLYIIHDMDEAFRWMWFWQGRALVDHDVITKKIKKFLLPSRSYSHPRLKLGFD